MSEYEPIKFPGWRYGPNGEAQIFDRAEDVPKGWTDNPNDFKTSSEAVVDEKSAPIHVEESASPATAPVEAKKKTIKVKKEIK